MPWTPDVNPIYEASEDTPVNVNIFYTPIVDPPEPAVISYQAFWTSVKIPSNVVLTILPAIAGVNVSGPNVRGLADIRVDYLLGGVPGFVTDWNDLPVAAEQLTKYAISGVNVNDATFTVRAYLFGGSYVEAGYILRATVNYTTGRDILVAEVDARR